MFTKKMILTSMKELPSFIQKCLLLVARGPFLTFQKFASLYLVAINKSSTSIVSDRAFCGRWRPTETGKRHREGWGP